MSERIRENATLRSERPVYVTGLDRSGKSILASLLTSHPHIAIPEIGSNMWTYFYRRYGNLAHEENFERCLQDMLQYKHVAYLKPNPRHIRAEFHSGPPTYARLFALFLKQYAERHLKPRWGAQSGLNERFADQIFKAHPQAKIIHIIRDPRDRYQASLALWPGGKGKSGAATARWLYSLRLARRNRRLYPTQYKLIRYEAVVHRPEATLREICSFLNEPFVPTMLEMRDAPGVREKITAGRDIPPGQSPLTTDYIGRFRDNVPHQEVVFIQWFAGKMMGRLGYQLVPHDFTLRDWLHFSLITWPSNVAR